MIGNTWQRLRTDHYGMAGLVIEMLDEAHLDIPFEVIPGVTAASAASAILGAPLMLDFATISLSDILVSWDQIVRRLEAVFGPESMAREAQ